MEMLRRDLQEMQECSRFRYRYSGSLRDNSRTFCVEMVGLSDGGKVYRKEDINQMSFSGVNGQFAPKGRSTYSIFKYKGGAYCHHKWQRLVYMRRRDGGKFLPKSKTEALENDRRVSHQVLQVWSRSTTEQDQS